MTDIKTLSKFKPVLTHYDRLREATYRKTAAGSYADALIAIRAELANQRPSQMNREWRKLREVELELERLIENERQAAERRKADAEEEKKARRLERACRLLRAVGREAEAAIIEEEDACETNAWSAVANILKVSVQQLDRLAERSRDVSATNIMAHAAHRLDQFRKAILDGPVLIDS